MKAIAALIAATVAMLVLGTGTAQAQCQTNCDSQGYCVTNCW
jgi:hypothetical protein